MADSNMPHSGAVQLTETASVMDPDFANFMDSVCHICLTLVQRQEYLLSSQVKSAGPEPPQATSEPAEGTNNKRKRDEDKKAAQPKKEKKPKAPRENTSVYVTGIPLDATFDEIHELFKSRGGLIMKNVDDEKPRIKMYADEEGNFKGEALISEFLDPTSPSLANFSQPSSKQIPSKCPCCYWIRPISAREALDPCASKKQT